MSGTTQEEVKLESKEFLLAQLYIGWHLLVHNCPAFFHGLLFFAVHLDLHLQNKVSVFRSGSEFGASDGSSELGDSWSSAVCLFSLKTHINSVQYSL